MSEQQEHQQTQPPQTPPQAEPQEPREPQAAEQPAQPQQHDATAAWVHGLSMFAGVMLILIGVLQAMEGLAAVLNDKFYVGTPNYVFEFDVTAWGWSQMLIGVMLAVAGYGVLDGRLWGRVIGIIVAVLSTVANFLYTPHSPVWSILIVLLNIAVIWALCVHSRFAEDA
ncbi:hypothetical protein J4573_09985 [Actinomadura barringtoniae]|uniref:DUF7144 domain-containing protein n=1 Tax=Actinomadura barringtoniae TaxID=1427535 RepID=A0A939T8Y6_9ACTN|nr:hypothetical protein [Actinomadura barringtoniae]MBO2447415.1 hypothetical protein [Actinomadura barringtoniae]